jgi:hypothetical protein
MDTQASVLAGGGSRREKVMALITVLACFFAFHRFWYSEARAGLEASRLGLEKEAKALAEKQARLKELSKMSPEKGALQELDAEIYALREFNGNYTNLIRRLSMEEGDAGSLKVRKISLEKREKVEEFTKVTFTVEVEGTFLSVGRFIEGIERSKLLAEVGSIELKRQPGELKRCTAKLRLMGYVARS